MKITVSFSELLAHKRLPLPADFVEPPTKKTLVGRAQLTAETVNPLTTLVIAAVIVIVLH